MTVIAGPATSLLRDDLRGRTPYGAPQLDVPVRLNINENSYAVPHDGGRPTSPPRWPRSPQASTATPTGSSPTLRDGPRGIPLGRTGVAVDADQVWAANGSNEVLQHLLQAFGGPGRTALGFTPAYSMHPLITRAPARPGSTACAAGRRRTST